MDTRKSRKPRGKPVVDELALAKSAAWAWHQRGSRSDGSGAIREFDAWRRKIEPKPSRYKLEALKKAQLVSDSPAIFLSSSRSSSSSHWSNSLFDSYEIERISKQLNYFIDSSSHVKAENTVVQKNENKSNWLKLHTPVCGSSRDDVVEINKGSFGSSRPEKGRRVAVVEVARCRPRCARARD